MLVYGDQCDIADPRDKAQEIARQLRSVRESGAGVRRHAALVAAFIEAGRLVQALADADFAEAGDELGRFLHRLGAAVCRSWDSGFAETGALPDLPQLRELPREVELRVPEGFAFYAVYPEAYIDAARRLKLIAPPRVIGIRSIGTSLSAAVAAAIGAPPPLTVRPSGDPFARQLTVRQEVERALLSGPAHFVIVDEGPGQSGSSFGAVADWLQQRGVPLDRIAFLPSHSGEIGPQASHAHRRRWAEAQRIPAEIGPRLPALLEQWLHLDSRPVEISAGEWRRHAAIDEEHWPAAMPPWERRKYLGRRGGDQVLVKFAALGALGERKLCMARALHSAGMCPEPLELMHGFIVERWHGDAQPLARDEKPIIEVARYTGTRARLFPAQAKSGATPGELLEMARRNVSLALGEQAAAALGRWSERTDTLSRRVVRVRTDNKLDRHEWLRTAGGRLLKTDALDHHAAHDLIGCQDFAWDVAGSIAEFGLDAPEAGQLIEVSELAAGRLVDQELLEFFQICYAAFRLGQAELAAQMCGADKPERSRLKLRAKGYAAALEQLLLESTRTATRQKSSVD